MTRVELHGAKSKDYEPLHKAMKQRGFSRTITGSDGIEYHLPFAEYNLVGEYTRNQVLRKAKAAVRETGTTASILVTKGSRKWSGLLTVEGQ